VLEHLEGAALAVKEINRILRQGGVLEHIPARLNRDSQTVADRRVLSSH